MLAMHATKDTLFCFATRGFNFATRKTNLDMHLVRSESPCGAELPSAYLHSLFFQIHPRRRFFINNFNLISSHRLKSISGTTIIIVNNNNFDFIAILLLAGGLKTTAE